MREGIKILELIDTYYPTVDGAINVAKHYCEELNKLSECKLAAPKPARKDKYKDKESFEVIRCTASPAPEKYRSAFPEPDRKFVRKIKREKFDVLHTHSPFAMGRFALKMGHKYKVPVIATLHTQYHQDFERVLKSKVLVDFMIKYIMKVFNNADSVWTVSNKSCEILRKYGYTGKIEVVRNGTDFKYPDNAQELVKKVNDLHGLEGQKNLLIFVGRMAWYKNLKIIVDAIEIIKRNGLDFKMLFVGGGFDLEEVKEYADKKGVSDRCIFTGAVKDKSLLQGYYLRGNLMVFPSTFDMAPVTAVEAAAHDLCAVMTRGSCSAECIEDGVNGFLAEENAESFADKIMEVLSQDGVTKKAGKEARKTLYRTWEMVAEEVNEKYKKVVADYKAEQEVVERLKSFKLAKKKADKEQKKRKKD